ncbi:hypothetical protein COCON_G00230790 [Conger conger]|uniref:Uncharacterized protein n=1 Tax=Conger conger TaxID=82655 RepID=A0A9Q1CVJ3_CONCO|nr:hypothetical protein COCON_G00230790 [Conger conger]
MRRRSRKSPDGGAMLSGGPDSPLPLHSALRCRLSPALGDHLSVALRYRLFPRPWGSPLCRPSVPSLPHPWGPPTLLRCGARGFEPATSTS